ncbi:MAG TPA: NADH-quinone oxidoreductase subunit J [Anaeromyxobacteraceae bacterium]|nr:NADH-quinone oxidoreductase subunit J [Anaeromyxobacteraceae bacterium]
MITHSNEILVGLLILVGFWTVQTSILRAAMGLALTSVLTTLILFQMSMPLAAVFELSVCAGLITVVFVSIISMTRPQNAEEEEQSAARRSRRYQPALLVAALVGLGLWAAGNAVQGMTPSTVTENVRDVLWNLRRLDLVGQIIIMFVGVFGVVVLFKDRLKEETGR